MGDLQRIHQNPPQRFNKDGPGQSPSIVLEAAPGYGFVPVKRDSRPEENWRTIASRKETLENLAARMRTFETTIRCAVYEMLNISHGVSVVRGWHDSPREDGTRIALMHSELSEMLEAIRKDSMDDHIPDRKGEEVEAADLLIRLLDHCGYKNLDIAGAWVEKTLYNIMRKDHSTEERAKAGGKKF